MKEGENMSVYKKNGRVDNLLGFLNIPNRHVETPEQMDLENVIDYADVQEKLAAYRRTSIQFLEESLADK